MEVFIVSSTAYNIKREMTKTKYVIGHRSYSLNINTHTLFLYAGLHQQRLVFVFVLSVFRHRPYFN